MIEITLRTPEDFLKIKETLTRMGIANSGTKTLYQSCHILQKQGKYFIVHFKEMLKLDGRDVIMTDEDTNRLKNIASLVSAWGMCTPTTPIDADGQNFFRVIPFSEKQEWKLVPKYKIGQVSSK